MTPKTEEFAPSASASVPTASATKALGARSERAAALKSWKSASINASAGTATRDAPFMPVELQGASVR